ncbi:MAG: methionine--tRNA ligase [Oscillospiraceae bacterium]|nr:methionine--tRNA ligase [Oscillospiraceae bacterium]
MQRRTFYVTTPIYYPSGNPHIGHAYCTVAADVISKYKKLRGFDVMFLTGTDEHGQKIEIVAKENNMDPKTYVDLISLRFKKLWRVLGITNDRFIRTTNDFHKKAVQRIFIRLYEKGDIYKGLYKGWYCTPCESFWTENQLVSSKCPDCSRDVHWSEEEAYFFKLSKYLGDILSLYDKNPNFVQPESRKNEMKAFIENGLQDICVSRTNFSWGINVPFDKNHVIYVWLDALTNYITALGYASGDDSDFKKFWPASVHFVGKEIVRFHAIIWPAILMALDLPVPKCIHGHGWWLSDDSSKMSKSKGNTVDPFELCSYYGSDAVRYFLLREVPFGSDGVFSHEALLKRFNSDLANDLGNLLSRCLGMIEKYFSGTLLEDQEILESDYDLINMAKSLYLKIEKDMDAFQFSSALSKIWKLVSRCNKYIEETKPWDLAKDGKNARLSAVLYNVCESLRIISISIFSFMPKSALQIQDCLGLQKKSIDWKNIGIWGILKKNSTVAKGEALFPRIEF